MAKENVNTTSTIAHPNARISILFSPKIYKKGFDKKIICLFISYGKLTPDFLRKFLTVGDG